MIWKLFNYYILTRVIYSDKINRNNLRRGMKMGNRILMIDKEINDSRKLKINLENLGYNVFISKNIEEGLLIINANNIDVIIIFDSDMDINKLRTNKVSLNVPIIGFFDISKLEEVSDLIKVLDDCVFKPYDKEQLYSKIKNQTKIKELEDLIKQKDIEINKIRKQLNDFSLIDEMTGLYNSFFLKQVLSKEYDKAVRYGYKLSGICFCLNNDFESEEVFKDVIKKLIDAMEALVRKSDIFVRLDDNEFYILLPYTGLKEALFVAEKLRRYVYESDFIKEQKVLLSFGVATLDDIDRGIKKDEEILKLARESMKKAIEKGGDIVECC